MSDRCAVCGKPECGYPARDRDGKAVFEFGGGESELTPVQMATLRADHAYDQRNGQLGTRPIAESPSSVPPPKHDWVMHAGMWFVLALMLAMVWYGFGCATADATSLDAVARDRLVMHIAQCIEEALPPTGSRVGSSAPSTAAPASVADAGVPTRRGIDTVDPWWEPDASDARVEIVRPGGE